MKMTNKEYIEADGNDCPLCRSKGTVDNQNPEPIKCKCTNCGGKWIDTSEGYEPSDN